MLNVKRGDIQLKNRHLLILVEKFLSRLESQKNLKDFYDLQKKIESWRKHNALTKKLRFQITGDDVGDAYINMYEEDDIKHPKKSYSTTQLGIEHPWDEYNKHLTKLYASRKMPQATFNRGYAWFKVKSMDVPQKKFRQYCLKHQKDIQRISQIDGNPYRRGIANEMLSFVNNNKSNAILMRNALTDSDHFSHNLAWRAILGKFDGGVLSRNQQRLVFRRALSLLRHPSAICKNKALLIIELGLQKEIVSETAIQRHIKIINVNSKSPNPIIADVATRIKRALMRS